MSAVESSERAAWELAVKAACDLGLREINERDQRIEQAVNFLRGATDNAGDPKVVARCVRGALNVLEGREWNA